MKKAPKITDVERSEIEILITKGYKGRAIAKVLGRSPNTVAEEIKRNSCGIDERTPASDRGRYIATKAKHKAYTRRKYAKYQGKKIQEDSELRSFIVSKLTEHWNPDEIAGYLKQNPSLGIYASKTAIYEWLHSAWGQRYCDQLYSKRYNRKPRKKNKTQRVMIPDRTGIEQRPTSASNRLEPGHGEYDSVVSSKRSGSTAALAVLQERTTRLVRARLVPNLKPGGYAETIVDLTNGLVLRTLTTDNGIENKQHKAITQNTGTPVFFTDPYSSWQKGGVENANKMLRRYFPKGTDFATVTQTDVVEALKHINNKPRKILGYKSSLQVAKEEGIILGGLS